MLVPHPVGRKQNFRNPNDSAYPPGVSSGQPRSGGERPVVIDRRQGVNGELVLRRAGADHEVIANGTFLMDTRDGRSERSLVREAVTGLGEARVLIGGLGVGFSLDEALRAPGVAEVVDLGELLETLEGPFDAICLDVDNGPGWLVHERNRRLYADAGLQRIHRLLPPGGRLTVWAAAADPGFEARLRARFDHVRALSIPVPRGADDVVYVAEISPSRSP